MAISQNFKTQVVFGGRIDPSFRRGTTELNDAIRQTSSTVGKLTKSQDKLKDKIAAMKLAGKDVSDLSAQYQKAGPSNKSDNAGPGGAEYSTC